MMLYSQILFIKKGKVELMGVVNSRIKKMLFTIHSIYDLYNSVLFWVSICR